MSAPFWVVPCFALIAAAYASVGLGGATAYAAVLSLTPVPYTQIPPLVLALNLLVAGGSFVTFHRAGRVPYRMLLPLLAASIPTAFAGGLVPIRERAFLILLAAALFMAGVRFLLGPALVAWRSRRGSDLRSSAPGATSHPGRATLLGLGAIIGFLSGITGIGGGVYLGPVLLLLGACDMETVPAVTGGFVFFNSAAGLAGQLTRIHPVFDLWIPLGSAVIVGAFAGAFVTLRWLPIGRMQRVFGCVLITAALLNGAKAL